MSLREMLSTMKIKASGLLSSSRARWWMATVVVLIVLLLVYRSMVSGAIGQALKQLENVVHLSEDVDKKLAEQKATMERDYNGKVETMQRKVQQIEQERTRLLQRLKDAEARLVVLEKRRQDVETYVYQPGEIDSRFSAILQRGKR